MYRHRQKSLNLYKWTSLFCLLSVLITGSVLIYQHKLALRTRVQELKKLAEQTERQYNLQQEHLVSINDLVNNPKIHAFFSDLLKSNAEKFASSKNLDISHSPLNFAGFHVDDRKTHREMGLTWREPKTVKISLNRLYLLNKFGHDKYFTSNFRNGDYTYSFVGFAEMIHTFSHELAHYIQLVKWGRSSCESDLILKTGKYDKELAEEHEEFTVNIREMIKNSEYSELKRKWEEI